MPFVAIGGFAHAAGERNARTLLDYVRRFMSCDTKTRWTGESDMTGRCKCVRTHQPRTLFRPFVSVRLNCCHQVAPE
jgi:hypothetical protein